MSSVYFKNISIHHRHFRTCSAVTPSSLLHIHNITSTKTEVTNLLTLEVVCISLRRHDLLKCPLLQNPCSYHHPWNLLLIWLDYFFSYEVAKPSEQFSHMLKHLGLSCDEVPLHLLWNLEKYQLVHSWLTSTEV